MLSRSGVLWDPILIGLLGILWCILWAMVGYNEPASHPRITKEERDYIESNIMEINKVTLYCMIVCS